MPNQLLQAPPEDAANTGASCAQDSRTVRPNGSSHREGTTVIPQCLLDGPLIFLGNKTRHLDEPKATGDKIAFQEFL